MIQETIELPTWIQVPQLLNSGQVHGFHYFPPRIIGELKLVRLEKR